VSSAGQLVDYFRGGAKPRAAWRIGIEQEKIAATPDGRPVPFDGSRGIEALLGRLESRGETSGYFGIREGERLVAVRRPGDQITLEPGGQVELSGPPLPTASACRTALLAHVREVGALGVDLGFHFLGVGLRPWGALDEIPWLPKRRYRVMREYLASRGRLAHHMMKCTATVQANFDYDDERTAAEKLRTALGVTSVVTALFAASPIEEGRPSGHRSTRAAIWLETDPERCGLLPFAFDDRFGFAQYVDWALDVPMLFLVRGDEHRPIGGITFRRFLREGWQGERPTVGDWTAHLSTLFPEVRLKRYIEVRGADAGPLPMAAGLAALWRGLLDDAEACRAAWALVRGVEFAERERLRRDVPRAGLAARLGDRPLRDLAIELCAISAAGLARLPGGADDLPLLAPVTAGAAAGRCPADDMLDDFQACGGDPSQLVARWTL
jgi:glutamate--cysteine ligase